MFARHLGIRAVQAIALVGVVAAASGCAAKVKKADYENDMARLREEIAGSDRQLGQRIDSTDQALADQQRRIDALDQEFKAFREEYKVSIEQVKGALKFAVPVHFAFDSSDVREGDHAVLDRFAAVMKQFYPQALITVEGFADPAGSAAYNKKLGLRRADAVKDYLTTTGGLQNIRSVSYGEDRNRQVVQGAAGPGDQGMENRRVALVVDHAAIATDGAMLR